MNKALGDDNGSVMRLCVRCWSGRLLLRVPQDVPGVNRWVNVEE